MDLNSLVKKYSNGEVTIVWKPSLCIHSKKCWAGQDGLREVFDPSKKPWITPEGATTERIIEQINKCPSGALSFFMNEETKPEEMIITENIVETVTDGPLMVYGNLRIRDKDGNETHKNKVTAFCRCGASQNKPFCDGSHIKIEFKG